MAHKKGAGSARNGRDSHSQRLGLKRHDGALLHAGTIIVRQRGTHFVAGLNVGLGRDDTLYAKAHGRLKLTAKGKNIIATIVPAVES